MTYALPILTLVLLAAAPAGAACTTRRCGADQQADVLALRAEIDASCDCAASAKHGDYVRCAKTAVKTARREGRISKACGRAVRKCEAKSTCGRDGAVVCCKEKKGTPVGRVKPSASKCGAATVCSQEPHASDACLADDQCCLSLVERGPPDVLVPGSPLAVASGFEVRANGPAGCAALDGPLMAFNYFSFADRDLYLQYTAQVVNVLRDHGHRAVAGGQRVETLVAPSGAPATGGTYEHEEFALAWYSSARGFLDFVTSEGQQSILHLQQAGARQSDYTWGLQRCIYGCEEAPPLVSGLLVVHVFRYEGTDFDASVDALVGAPGAAEVFYAGENEAEFRIQIGEQSINPQIPPWGRGAVAFRVPSRDDAVAWIEDPAYTSFQGETAEDVIILVDAGALADTGSSFTLKMLKNTGETPFAQLAYECDECSFAQFAAIEPPPGWSKAPTQVILPIGELRSTPSFEGVPSSMDFVPAIPGNEFKLIAKALDGRILEVGEDGIMAVVEVMRDTRFRFPAGSRVHELTDPEGNVFVLFAYEVESEDFTSPDFEDADALLGYPRPAGWTYSTHILDEDLVMESNGVATVMAIVGETDSTWEQR